MNEEEKYVLFELKNKFLGPVPHPKLIVKAIKQAYVKSGMIADKELVYHTHNRHFDTLHLDLFLQEIVTDLLQIKHAISTADSYHRLGEGLERLLVNHLNLIHKLNSYVAKSITNVGESIKVSGSIDAYHVLKMIQQRNLKDHEIKNYLCNQIDQDNSDELLEIFLRANKIAQHA